MRFVKTVLLSAVIFLSPLAVFAQAPAVEVNGSYDFTRVNASVGDFSGKSKTNAFNANGGGGQIAVSLTKNISAVGDLSGIAFVQTSLVPVDVKVGTFTFGVRANARPEKWTFYAQALGGVAAAYANIHAGSVTSNLLHPSDVGPALLVGGGLERELASWAYLRVFEVDYLRTDLFSSVQNSARVGAGITFRLGSRR